MSAKVIRIACKARDLSAELEASIERAREQQIEEWIRKGARVLTAAELPDEVTLRRVHLEIEEVMRWR